MKTAAPSTSALRACAQSLPRTRSGGERNPYPDGIETVTIRGRGF